VGRGREMQETLEAIFYSRLVTIKGLPGIGKTSMSQAVAYFLDERMAFRDGIMYFTLRGLESLTMFQTRMFQKLSPHLSEELKGRAQEEPEEVAFSFLQEKEMLLVLDDIEAPCTRMAW